MIPDLFALEAAPAVFEVVMYRGDMVASRAGWIADAKSRGGQYARIPSGFWAGTEAMRWGSAGALVYELPPLWLLILQGTDDAAYRFNQVFNYTAVAEAADNQMQDLRNIGVAVGAVGDGIIKSLPAVVYIVAIAAAVYVAATLYSAVRE